MIQLVRKYHHFANLYHYKNCLHHLKKRTNNLGIQLSVRYLSTEKLISIEDVNDFQNFYIYENYIKPNYRQEDSALLNEFKPTLRWHLSDLRKRYEEKKGQNNDIQLSEFLFSKLIVKEDPTKSFEKIIKELVKDNDMSTAYELFLKLTHTPSIKISKSIYNWMMYGYLLKNDLDLVKEIFNHMKKYNDVDLISYHILLKAYGNHDIIFAPETVFRIFRSSLLAENVITCNILLEIYSNIDSSIEYSDMIVEHMKRMAIIPNIWTFYYLIKCTKNDIDKALNFARLMEDYYLKKNDLILEGLLHVYIHSGHRTLEDVKKFVDEFYESNPDVKQAYRSLYALVSFYFKNRAYDEGMDMIERYLDASKEESIPKSFCTKILTLLKNSGISNAYDIEKWENENLNNSTYLDRTFKINWKNKISEWKRHKST